MEIEHIKPKKNHFSNLDKNYRMWKNLHAFFYSKIIQGNIFYRNFLGFNDRVLLGGHTWNMKDFHKAFEVILKTGVGLKENIQAMEKMRKLVKGTRFNKMSNINSFE